MLEGNSTFDYFHHPQHNQLVKLIIPLCQKVYTSKNVRPILYQYSDCKANHIIVTYLINDAGWNKIIIWCNGVSWLRFCSYFKVITVFPQLDARVSISRLCVGYPTSKGAKASIWMVNSAGLHSTRRQNEQRLLKRVGRLIEERRRYVLKRDKMHLLCHNVAFSPTFPHDKQSTSQCTSIRLNVTSIANHKICLQSDDWGATLLEQFHI